VPRFTPGRRSSLSGPGAPVGRARGRTPSVRPTDVHRPLRVAPVRIDGEVSRSEGWPTKVSLVASSSHLAPPRCRGHPGSLPPARGAPRPAGDPPVGNRGRRPSIPAGFPALHGSCGHESFRRRGALRGVPYLRQKRGISSRRDRDTRPRPRWHGRSPCGSRSAFASRGRSALVTPGTGWWKSEAPLLSSRTCTDRGSPPRGGEDLGNRSRRIPQLPEGGFELSGKDLSARMDPTGVRWTGGTILAAGNPLRISGRVSWGGDLDIRVEGKLPASAVRLAVPSVFDRLDGTVTLEARSPEPGIPLDRGDRSPGRGYRCRSSGTTSSSRGSGRMRSSAAKRSSLNISRRRAGRLPRRMGRGPAQDGRGAAPLLLGGLPRHEVPYPEDFRPVVQGHVELIGPVDDILVAGDVEVQSARYTRVLYPAKALVDFSRKLSDVVARRKNPNSASGWTSTSSRIARSGSRTTSRTSKPAGSSGSKGTHAK